VAAPLAMRAVPARKHPSREGRISIFVRLLPTRSPLRGLCLFSFVFYKYATPTGFSCRRYVVSTSVTVSPRDMGYSLAHALERDLRHERTECVNQRVL
jgi:hypothetical protein